MNEIVKTYFLLKASPNAPVPNYKIADGKNNDMFNQPKKVVGRPGFLSRITSFDIAQSSRAIWTEPQAI